MVKVRGLTKIYKTPFKNRDGFLSALKFLFSPTYKEVVAVNNINMNIEAGDIHALIGPNGAGKSTIIKVLSGVLYPTDGMVEVLGYIPWKDRTAYVKNIGVLFGQKSQLYWEPPALDTYTLYREIYNIPYQLYKKNLDYLVELFDIGDIVRKPVRNLSLGERMRCEFLCSLLHEPQLVILDEPTIGLDIVSKDIMRDLIRRINEEKRTTFILTTHDVSDIVNLCKNVTIINHGSIVFQDTLRRLKTYFSNTKDIELTFFKTVPQELIEHFKIKLINSQTGNISIDLKNGSYSHQVTKILKYLPVDDINVLPTNTESIIKDIYQQKKYCQYEEN